MRNIITGAALGLTLGAGSLAQAETAGPATQYPPVKTGMRGSHPGSFEAAHALFQILVVSTRQLFLQKVFYLAK